MRKILAVSLLLAGLSLSGCMVRMTGPCLGYGCPAMTGGATNALNKAPNAAPNAKAPAITAKNAPASSSRVHAGN
ncbi:MAG TPA: hypothetical protein VJR26_01955 [Candidatus Acidoferrales bacterium]|nr:hypothetical protein [Candidatus Acidoferrales bacterium]